MYINYFSISISIGLVISFILFYKFPLLKKEIIKNNNRKISVVIPIRNEEKNIENLLNDLKKQTLNVYEIICVDDDSSDNSANIIKNYDVKYLFIKKLKAGWRGKPLACQKGAELASGDILIFLDADVRLKESAIESLISAYDRKKTPISVQPYHNVSNFYEYFSYFFNLIQICATSLSLYNNQSYTGFYGPVFLVERKMFLDNGGYSNVKANVLEDLHLAKFYKKINIDVDLLMGGNIISFTMYPNGFKQLLEGWSKNFSQVCASVNLKLFLMVFCWIGYLYSLPIEIVKALIFNNYYGLNFLISIYIITVIKLRKDTKKLGSFPFYISLFYPVFLFGFIIIFLLSIIKTYVLKNTTWKGRRL